MESPGRFTNKQVKHTTKQNLSDQSKQDIHTKIIEERKFKTLKISHADNQMDNLNPYDRIKSPLLKKCYVLLYLDWTKPVFCKLRQNM